MLVSPSPRSIPHRQTREGFWRCASYSLLPVSPYARSTFPPFFAIARELCSPSPLADEEQQIPNKEVRKKRGPALAQ